MRMLGGMFPFETRVLIRHHVATVDLVCRRGRQHLALGRRRAGMRHAISSQGWLDSRSLQWDP